MWETTAVIAADILGTASVLRGRRRTTAELAAEAMPDRDPVALRRLTGIATRYWIDPETSTTELAVEALRGAASGAGLPVSALRRVILVNSTGGDRLCPADVNTIIHALGLDGRADGFDLDNACTGFLTALDLAARCLATGMAGPIGVVVVETPSRHVTPEIPRPYMVFGDAAMAAILGADPSGKGGILGSHFGNMGAHRDAVFLDHPERAGERTWLTFAASRDALFDLALGALRQSAAAVLDPLGLSLEEVEWVVPHQPNGYMLRNIVRGLGVPAEKMVAVVEEIGSVGAASVAVGLDRLLRERPVLAGHRVLLLGVGAGMSYGAVLYQVGR